MKKAVCLFSDGYKHYHMESGLTMKISSIKKAILTTGLICLMLITLAACSSGLKGTYKSSGLIAQTFTFGDNSSVTMSAFGVNTTGTYKISGDKMTVDYTLLGINSNWSCTFQQKGSDIYIDGTEFTKQ